MTSTAALQPAKTHGHVRRASVLAAICAVIYVLTAAYTSVSGDVTATNVLSWQLGTTGDPSFGPKTFPPLDQHEGRDIWIIETADGDEVIGRSPGAVIAAVPAYWLVGGAFSLAPGAVTAALLTAVSAFAMALVLLRTMPAREATLGCMVFAVGTPVWSIAANGMWPHTITVLGICGMAWAAGRDRWWLVGLMGGVVLWGRLHAALIVAVFGLALGWRRRDPVLTAKVAAGSAVMMAGQAGWTRAIYGSWNPMSSYDTGPFEDYAGVHRFDIVNHLGFWFSPDRGLLVWSPVIALLLPALLREWRNLPDWSRALLWGGLAYTVLQGFLNRFSGGDSFYGYRLTLELLACATPALALSSHRMRTVGRRLFAPVLALQVFIISAGAVNGRLGSPAEDAWHTHTFFDEFSGQPMLLAGFFAVCLAAGVLGRRIWREPGIRNASSSSNITVVHDQP